MHPEYADQMPKSISYVTEKSSKKGVIVPQIDMFYMIFYLSYLILSCGDYDTLKVRDLEYGSAYPNMSTSSSYPPIIEVA